MALFKKILHYAGFAKKDDMAKPVEFVPSDIFKHRYQDPKVLITYVKGLPDGFTDDQITVKPVKDGQLGLKLPRKLEKEEIEGVNKAFIKAERDRQRDNGA
ncbi:hypothetical protein J7T55_009933 [Diaporthe amygdali]|uniref:uncharacterized protein n=1 Tax=Phomopsis amygdali TaxID=1214568 RepID=UPI0022FEC2E3|nr:uncharacterized protein J7T55_009933 [Diaporthe amygdali]KAJ0116782.1 hypothetical protein J7T55_009933 [Diaporthe amygdali]